jgi:uncharacterized protein
MRRSLIFLSCWILAVVPCIVQAQTYPLVDHHQHLLDPATVALVAPQPPAPVTLPADLDGLIQAQARSANDAAALRELYTDDVWLTQSSVSSWIRGREAVAAWWTRWQREPFQVIPVGSTVSEPAGFISAYINKGRDAGFHPLANALFSVRKDAGGRWRIAAVAISAAGPPFDPISARDLITLLDQAGIRRAVVLSVAYTWASPNRNVENEYEKVKAENDWTSRQVAEYPDRLRGFCGLNPLRPYALEELARCAKDPQLHYGLKLHFGNSVVDVHNPQHVEQLRRIFRAANDYHMAIVVHMRASFSARLPYGRNEARMFLDEILPAAPDVPIQIAHLAGGGGYDDPAADEALDVFAEAIARHDPRTKHLYFDISGAAGFDLNMPPAKAKQAAARIRRLGLDRILFGSDTATGGNLDPRQAWIALHQLPLTDAEFQKIANNVAPYMR